MALQIANQQSDLRKAGWKIISSEPHIVDRLNNKVAFHRYAMELGLTAHFPKFYFDPEKAEYPCILKPGLGSAGNNSVIVNRSSEALGLIGTDSNFDAQWVLQEIVAGHVEYSTSLLVHRGNILGTVSIKYEYKTDVYIWPHVEEVNKTICEVDPQHFEVMRKFVAGFSGFCNFNYKVQSDGKLCLFEANARIGGDLAGDVVENWPHLAYALFEKLDALECEHEAVNIDASWNWPHVAGALLEKLEFLRLQPKVMDANNSSKCLDAACALLEKLDLLRSQGRALSIAASESWNWLDLAWTMFKKLNVLDRQEEILDTLDALHSSSSSVENETEKEKSTKEEMEDFNENTVGQKLFRRSLHAIQQIQQGFVLLALMEVSGVVLSQQGNEELPNQHSRKSEGVLTATLAAGPALHTVSVLHKLFLCAFFTGILGLLLFYCTKTVLE
eukprot:gnl/MRDRNA2_/MRDRNA2_240109_c0_seq1.p1 gnl/MRDRNA2_/MRDRNA2_240109_c0~~gnl/MRDRNA2_/MRDRNA2_240109_c0_seq1.p1  ORF type:complete len:461 (+),score=88.89 gnl/MRDRNA2_/MRDRNA2_240109_c0_seq1:54-1385(+)